jgi:hypothetical protein
MVNRTQTEALKKYKQRPYLFCISDAFRVFAQRSSITLGTRGLAAAVLAVAGF